MATIYDLSWARTSFTEKLLLFVKSILEQRRKINSVDARVKASGYSALSSTYYSIAGTAGAQKEAIQKQEWGFLWVPLFLVTWMPLGGWCWWRMLYISDRVEALIGYGGMTAAQCDIRQSVLRAHARFYEAKVCIEFGLRKEFYDMHTAGLLHCGMAHLFMREGSRMYADVHIRAALDAVSRAKQTDPRQAGRIYRGCAPIADWAGMSSPFTGAELRQRAEVLAIVTDAADQLLKLMG